MEELASLITAVKSTRDRTILLREPPNCAADLNEMGPINPGQDKEAITWKTANRMISFMSQQEVMMKALAESMDTLVKCSIKSTDAIVKLSNHQQAAQRNAMSIVRVVKGCPAEETVKPADKNLIHSVGAQPNPVLRASEGRDMNRLLCSTKIYSPLLKKDQAMEKAKGPDVSAIGIMDIDEDARPRRQRLNVTAPVRHWTQEQQQEESWDENPMAQSMPDKHAYKDWRKEATETSAKSHENPRLSPRRDVSNDPLGSLDSMLINQEKASQQMCCTHGGSTANRFSMAEFKLKQASITRTYRLKANSEYAPFEDFLFTELKSRKLFYIFSNESNLVPEDELMHDKNVVREIILNRIDEKYHLYTMSIKDPVELLAKLKGIKRGEYRINPHTAQKRLFNRKMIKDKETAFEFCLKFETLMREYESVEGVRKLPDVEKKSLLYNAVLQVFPEIATAENLAKHSSGKGYDYDQLKDLIFQIDASKSKDSSSQAMMISQSRTPSRSRENSREKEKSTKMSQRECSKSPIRKRCERCGSVDHIRVDCKHKDPKCFNCNQFGHIASGCTEPRKRRGEASQATKRQSRRSDSKSPRRNRQRSASRSPATKVRRHRSLTPRREKGKQHDICLYSNAPKYEHTLEKFVVDSGATSHLTNSRMIFTSLNNQVKGIVGCANKNPKADLHIQGQGNVTVELKNGKRIELQKVIYAKDLSRNLLSLKKFTEQGLCVYLDKEKVNIFDPKNKQNVLEGRFEDPFWIVELKTCTDDMNVNVREALVIAETEKDKTTKRVRFADQENNTNEQDTEMQQDKVLDTINLWHIRLGHPSVNKVKRLKKIYPDIKNFKETDHGNCIQTCEICKIAKMNKLKFDNNREKATKPLHRVSADTMGPITPATHPKKARFIVVLVDNYSRYAMAYAVEHKSDAPECIDDFVKTCRNTGGEDYKFCYLDCDQGTEFTSERTAKVLRKYGAELRTVCPYTPQLNGIAERYNQTIQKITRALMFDSRMPANAWDLSLKAAVYIYNLTPHKTLNFQSPLLMLNPKHKVRINQLRRFGCVAFAKIFDKPNTKFDQLAIKTVLVGYTDTGYLLLNPEDGKIYESRNVKFHEDQVFGDVYKEKDINNWTITNEQLCKETWMTHTSTDTTTQECDVPESEPVVKRNRGRPAKGSQTAEKPKAAESEQAKKERPPKRKAAMKNAAHSAEEISQYEIQALVADINGDPKSYREAMASSDAVRWKEAVQKEVDALDKNQVFEVIERPNKNGKRLNVLDSRWVFRKKIASTGNADYKARIVIRGFKDMNLYDLCETYAPVSRLPLVRAVIAIANKFDLILWQLDVKAAFLHSPIKREILMEIPDGYAEQKIQGKDMVWRLKKSLYGLKTSPKNWNLYFTKHAENMGFKASRRDPCLFLLHERDTVVILLLYVDDILLAGNKEERLNQIQLELAKRFDMKLLGEPKEFLGLSITRNQSKREIKLDQKKFIDKMQVKFGYSEAKPQNTPMVTNQVLNKERKNREENVTIDKVIDQRKYREIVGSLIYLVNGTRPDIA